MSEKIWDLGTITVHGKALNMSSSGNSFDKLLENSTKTYEQGISGKTGFSLGGLFGGISAGISWGKVILVAGGVVLLVLVLRRK